MEYLALYRKWRPPSFAQFVGQPHVVRTLRHAVAQNRVAHAYLFSGPRGTGKTTAAKILARAVNCPETRDGDPCGECPSCRRIAAGTSLDVQEIDGASNRGIDEVRDLREKARFAPAEGRYRVYIIDEVHMLTGEAFNALLKTLEEPPPQVIFIFATTEAHKLPATVLSRCQRFEFKRFTQGEIADRLAEIARSEGIEIEPAALALLAAQAAGGMRDAIGLLEQAAAHAGARVTEADVREVLGLVDLEVYLRLAEAARDRDPAAALTLLAEVGASGKDLAQFARGAAALWRDLLVLAVSRQPAPLQVLPAGADGPWRELAAAIGPERLLHAVDLFASAAAEQKRTGEPRLPLDLALIKLTTGLGASAMLETGAAAEERPAAPPGARGVAPPAAERRMARPSAAAGKGTEGTPSGGAEIWGEVQAGLRKAKPSLGALLSQHARPEGIKGQAFVLRFANRIFAEKAEADREIVERILAEVCGRPLTLRCEAGALPADPAGPSSDPVAEAVRLFDGVIEED
ncbi:MAG: DNA polymerase III subunit gamma/tau [Bacteroidota bacterium]